MFGRRLFLLPTVLALVGCIAEPDYELSHSRIVVTNTHKGSFEHAREALAEFAAKYDYSVSDDRWGLSYHAVSGVFRRIVPNSSQRPWIINVFLRADSVVVEYHGHADIPANSNPVIKDLKQLLLRYAKGERISYKFTPGHWTIIGAGD
ncbi:MAG TPA: hypothetical protein VLK27_08830 [Chthoniobacterales bacterium]|nr:hypothetical protein [Chthoniobacterales bacterium]